MEQVEVQTLVIGAGVIGLACARELALSGRSVWLLEAQDGIGSETSSRNSEVIHAGIYYPDKSLKARFCVEGKELLYRYLDEHTLPYHRCGKLIVAKDESQRGSLENIKRQAERNRVCDLVLLSAAQVAALEPELQCAAALLSPSTGIMDSHVFMHSLQYEAESQGATLLFKQKVLALLSADRGLTVLVQEDSGAQYQIVAKEVVSACGLQGEQWLRETEVFPREVIRPLFYAKGNYFYLQGKSPFSRLIYPVPEPGGLGVHLTLNLAGKARFGPDVEWVSSLDYRVAPERGDKFYHAVRQYWPQLPDESLVPDYAGIRPKLSGPGDAAEDFCIQDVSAHGIRGLINLTGMESPGLTASLAIARDVLDRLNGTQIDSSSKCNP